MKITELRIIGGIFVLIGLVLTLNSVRLITGFVILSNLNAKASAAAGIFFLVCGILILFVAGRERKRELVRYSGKKKEDAEKAYQESQLKHFEDEIEEEEDVYFGECGGDRVVLGPHGRKPFLRYVKPSDYEFQKLRREKRHNTFKLSFFLILV